MIKKILLGLLCGLIATVWLAQHDTRVKVWIADTIKKSLESLVPCTFSAEVAELNLFRPHFTLHNISVASADGSSWRCEVKKYQVYFSWLHLFLNGSIDLNLIIDDVVLTKQSKQALIEYCKDDTVHSLLQITFQELLVAVWNQILINDSKDEIKSQIRTINEELPDEILDLLTDNLYR